jgi:hypothetical protein
MHKLCKIEQKKDIKYKIDLLLHIEHLKTLRNTPHSNTEKNTCKKMCILMGQYRRVNIKPTQILTPFKPIPYKDINIKKPEWGPKTTEPKHQHQAKFPPWFSFKNFPG